MADRFVESLIKVVNALNETDVHFAVGGGCAVYVRGGPATSHDVDIFLKPSDVKLAVSTLVRAGMRAASPPEDWLAKVYDGRILVDLIYRPNYRSVDDELLQRASRLPIGPTSALVISATDLLIDKLMVLNAHQLDFGPLLEIARALGDDVNWDEVRDVTQTSAYARAFLNLIEDLNENVG
ncbi:MAG: nucleotidyltransferase [Nocardiaceae bacterium]|nr:nucleotidyltransferase [Nocardiaceae bacterium]